MVGRRMKAVLFVALAAAALAIARVEASQFRSATDSFPCTPRSRTARA